MRSAAELAARKAMAAPAMGATEVATMEARVETEVVVVTVRAAVA